MRRFASPRCRIMRPWMPLNSASRKAKPQVALEGVSQRADLICKKSAADRKSAADFVFSMQALRQKAFGKGALLPGFHRLSHQRTCGLLHDFQPDPIRIF